MKNFEASITQEDINTVKDLLKTGNIGFGDNVNRFEHKFSAYSKKKYNVGLNSASSAAYCIFSYLYHRYGECDVYTPSLGFISPAWSAIKNGHNVIFVDVDDNLLFDFESYKSQKIKSGNKKILMPVLYGGVSDIPEFSELVSDELVVVDSAHCINPNISSDYIFFSFHPVKPLTMSCGGILATDDEDAHKYLISYRNFGRILKGDTYDIDDIGGFNFYMNNLNASLGISQMKSCYNNIIQRKNNYQFLKNNIDKDVGHFIEHDENSSYYLCTMVLKNESSENLRKKLKKLQCTSSFHYPYLHETKYFNSPYTLKNLQKLKDKIINLPIHQNLSNESLKKLVKAINE